MIRPNMTLYKKISRLWYYEEEEEEEEEEED